MERGSSFRAGVGAEALGVRLGRASDGGRRGGKLLAHRLLDGSNCRDGTRQRRRTGGGGCLDAKTALGMGLYHIGVHERLVIQL